VILINPFDAKRIVQKLTQSSIVKIDKLDVGDSSDDNTESKEIKPNQDLFIALRAPLAKKVDGERRSVVLTETDVQEVLAAFEHGVRAHKLMAWSVVPIPLSVLWFPLVSNIESEFLALSLAMGPSVAIAGVLLCLSQIAFWRYMRELKRLADVYWDRGFVVSVPKHLNRAYFRNQLRVMSGPIAAFVLDEVINVVPNEKIKLTYHALDLGREVVNWPGQADKNEAPDR
jgi:hypothetical protein